MEPVEDLVQLKISSVSQWVKWFAKQRNKKVPQVQSFSCWRFFRSFPGSKQLTHLEQDLLNIKLRFYILSQRFFKETSRRGSCSLFAHIFFPYLLHALRLRSRCQKRAVSMVRVFSRTFKETYPSALARQ